MLVCFAGIPQIDELSLDADGLLAQAVAGEHLAVQDQMRQALGLGALQCLVQLRRLLGEYFDDLVEVAVGGGPGDAMIASQRGGISSRGTSANRARPARNTSTPWRPCGCRAENIVRAVQEACRYSLRTPSR